MKFTVANLVLMKCLLATSLSYAQAISPQEQALISQLEEILLPERIGLWPPAPSVWITLVIVLIILGLLIYAVRNTRKKKAYRKTAQKERLKIIKFYEKQKKKISGNELIGLQQKTSKELLSLLKKTYFTAYQNNRSAAAGRYGTEFITLLRANLENKHREQSWSKVHIDNDALYRSTAAFSEKSAKNDLSRMIEHLNTFSKQWIDHHSDDEKRKARAVAKSDKSSNKGSQTRV